MSTFLPLPKDPSEACETILKKLRANRVEAHIVPSEVAIIDHLLTRKLELQDAYHELYEKLANHHQALHVFFDQLLSIAAFWSPEANWEARRKRARLQEVNGLISAKAAELAELIEERTELKNKSGFSCDTYYHPVDLIHAAAEGNYTYQNSVKEKLQAITRQFDLKCWPSISEILQALADDAEKAEPVAHDAVTEAGTEGNRAALADTFRAFFVAVEEASAKNYGFIPNDFEITDRSVAILISCALNLGVDDTVDSGYVKRLRQRQRQKQIT